MRGRDKGRGKERRDKKGPEGEGQREREMEAIKIRESAGPLRPIGEKHTRKKGLK